MDDTRGLVLHRGLEEHVNGGRVAAVEFDRFLKVSTLFHRGLVVTDSDLNNNPLFHEVTQRDPRVFEEAIRGGHLVRAARVDDHGGRVRQEQIYRHLRARNAARAGPVPDGHPEKLDGLLDSPSARTLEWSAGNLTSIFHTRCKVNLQRAVAERWLGDDATVLAERVLVYLEAGPDLGAADIEHRFRSGFSDGSPTWASVWRIILDSWGGNVAFAFGGDLIVAQDSATVDGVNPSGPGAPEDLVDRAVDYYRALGNGDDEDYGYRRHGGPVDGLAGGVPAAFRINYDRLMNLSLDEISLLRERADPEPVIDLRARVLASPEALEDGGSQLAEAALGYWDRLASADLVYDLTTEWMDTDAALMYADVRMEQEFRAAEVTLLRSVAGLIPGVGYVVSLLDVGEAAKTLGVTQDRQRFMTEFRQIAYRRPDYRVIEKLAGDL